MDKEWCKIRGFSRYAISNAGNIVNLETHRDLKPYANREGRLQVRLVSDSNMSVNHYVHRLVAEHFMPHYDSSRRIRHIDALDDNHISNLEQLDWLASPRRG